MASSVLVFLALGMALLAQNVSSSVRGEAIDSTGAAAVGATCTLTNEATGRAETVKSLADGAFTFANVSPGVCTLTIENPGFKLLSLRGFAVTSGELSTLERLMLNVGELKERVTVTSEAAALQLASAERVVKVNLSQFQLRVADHVPELWKNGRVLISFQMRNAGPGVLRSQSAPECEERQQVQQHDEEGQNTYRPIA